MTRRQKIILMTIAAGMFYLLLLVIFGDNGFWEFHRMRATHADLLQTNERLNKENLHLYRIIDRLQNDPEFIEFTARRELGMIRPNEYIFKLKGDAKQE